MTVTEAELKAVAVAPRVTLEDVHEAIKNETYLYTDTLTVCVLTLKNGYTVTGESACASPANFNRDIGNRLAKENAVKKIWAYLGFELKTKLTLIEEAGQPSGSILLLGSPHTYVGTKVVHAVSMDRKTYNDLRGWILPAEEDGDDLGFLVQYTDSPPNVAGFDGYISWSPRDVFERAYTTDVRQNPDNFLTKMFKEQEALLSKLTWLVAFSQSEDFKKIPQEEQDDFLLQAGFMEQYAKVLDRRLARNMK